MSDQSPNQTLAALLHTLVRLYLENPAPKPEETQQFQDILLHVLPKLDHGERRRLVRLVANNTSVPKPIRDALAAPGPDASQIQEQAQERERASNTRSELSTPSRVGSGRRAPGLHKVHRKTSPASRPNLDQLRKFLPLQIPRAAIKALEVAVRRGDHHTQRTLLARHADISRPFAEAILSEHNAFALALALKTIRLPADVARRILPEQVHSSKTNNPGTAYDAFCELDPEASRQQLEQLQKAFEDWHTPIDPQDRPLPAKQTWQSPHRSLEDLLRHAQTHATSILSDVRRKA